MVRVSAGYSAVGMIEFEEEDSRCYRESSHSVLVSFLEMLGLEIHRDVACMVTLFAGRGRSMDDTLE